MSDEEKQRLKDYQKNYHEAKKLINSNTLILINDGNYFLVR